MCCVEIVNIGVVDGIFHTGGNIFLISIFSARFGSNSIHKTSRKGYLINKCKFHENWHTASHAILRNVNEFVAVLWTITALAQLVAALRFKSEGRGFDSRWCHWNFSLK